MLALFFAQHQTEPSGDEVNAALFTPLNFNRQLCLFGYFHMYEEKSAPAVSCNLSQRSVACHMNAADQRGHDNKNVLSLSG